MSKISDIYDGLITRLETILPSHIRLSNPYNPPDNMSQSLRQGWGLRIEEGANTEFAEACILTIRRSLSVVITRRFYSNELDAEARSTTEKDLLEDHLLVIKDFENQHTIIPTMIAIKWVTDSGIETISTGTETFIQTIIGFEIQYTESLT